jgi:hypothetical protein
MEKEFIPYKQAVELKELGFDEPCLAFYDGKETNQVYYNSIRNGLGDYEPFKNNERLKWFGAPLYQQAFRWFREKYNLKFHIRQDNWNNWCSVYILISDEHERVGDYLTYEEAELACLNKLIQTIKTK